MRTQRALTGFLAVGFTVLGGALGCSNLNPLEPRLEEVPLSPSIVQTESATQRPLSDFLSAQGSTNIFIPPVPDFIAWVNNDPQNRFASIDYAGLAAGYLASNGGPSLGTEVSGTISERPLADGRAQVSVVLHTMRALSWAVTLPGDFANDPLLFGYRPAELIADPTLTPALSNSQFKVVFKNDAPGAPLPDLVDALFLGGATPGFELVSLMFRSNGAGPLRAPSGASEGTPGRLIVTQTGLFMTGFHGATADGFPAERVELRVVGKGTLKQ